MADRQVVITGIGVIASNGIGREAFINSLIHGASGIKPVSLFDTSLFKAKLAGEVRDFKAEDFLGVKGLRTLDRSTKLASASTKLALDDANLQIREDNATEIGMALGSTLGSISSIIDFDKEALVEGPRYVNPALFPNTVINSPASQVSIRFNIKGFNATVSTAFSASLDAIGYALDFLRTGRVNFVLSGGVEELCLQTFLGFYKSGCLAGTDGVHPEICSPFDQRRNGVILGEGSGIFLLEDLQSAKERKAKIYAEVKGFGTGFTAHSINKYDSSAKGLCRAMQLALDQSRLNPEDIDYICAAANSTQDADLIETKAVKKVFGSHAPEIPLSAPKSMLGECFSASGSFGLAAALGAIEKQNIPPTINYQQKDPLCDLDYVVNQPRSKKIENVLINAFGPSGCNSSLVVSEFKG
ncbi:MAG: beta-ketoacyl-[acyl-carrier-protein] synthase family protein [Candidatus Omnitrophica bacterium]|nr:beta-ketoacyl-[acyl-carrier-protein] synthase family protein [Candidatus Omnitrophota bacterium]